SLRAGLRAHTYGASFISRSESCSQLSAEFVILLPIYLIHKVFVSSIKNSFVPFNHEAPSPLMGLGAFAIVAEERGFLKLLPCAQAHNSTAVLLRRQFAVIRPIVHLDGDSLILEPHSSGHHVPLPYFAYGSDQRLRQ